MANHLKSGEDSTVIHGRHGQTGCTQVRLETMPVIKTRLVAIARRRGVTLKTVLNEAVLEYLLRHE